MIFFVGFSSFQAAYSQESGTGYEFWFWQKGVEANTEQGENYAKTIFSFPASTTNSDFKTLDYLFVFTNEGDYIRAGVVYESTVNNGYLAPTSLFFSDDKTNYFTFHPYRPSTEMEIAIYHNDGWKISFIDSEVGLLQEFDAPWASGEFINYGGIVLENGSEDKDIILSCEHVGAINGIENQELFFGINNDEWRKPQSARLGYEINQQSVSGTTILYQIPPPDFSYITETKTGYEIGFDCEKTQQEPTQESESLILELENSQANIPDWVKNSMKWYVEGKISEQEMINALQFLIKLGTIKLD